MLTSDKAPIRELSEDEKLYYANYGFDSLISECCTWHHWQFAPSEGICRKGVYKQFTEFELEITPMSNMMFIYRQKKEWDKLQITSAQKAEANYVKAMKAAAKKRR